MNSLDFNVNPFFRCWYFYWEKNEEDSFKCWESDLRKSSEWLGKDQRWQTHELCPPSLFHCTQLCVVLLRDMRREEGKGSSQCAVELRHHEEEAEQMCSFYIHTLFLYALLTFLEHAHIQVQITWLWSTWHQQLLSLCPDYFRISGPLGLLTSTLSIRLLWHWSLTLMLFLYACLTSGMVCTIKTHLWSFDFHASWPGWIWAP